MKTLRTAYFNPAEGSIHLYTSEDGFSNSQPTVLTAHPPQMQGIVSGAMAWLTSKLPEGMALTQVILTRLTDVPATRSEGTEETPSEVLTWSASFEISATGGGDKGETTLQLISEVGPITDAVTGLWDHLVATINE